MADAPPKKSYPVDAQICKAQDIVIECAPSVLPSPVNSTAADQLAIAKEALDAIDKITNTANFWLTTMSVAITVISLFSIGVIISLLRGSAFKRVDKGFTEFLNSQNFKDSLDTTVANALDNRRESEQGTATEPGELGPEVDLNQEANFPDVP